MSVLVASPTTPPSASASAWAAARGARPARRDRHPRRARVGGRPRDRPAAAGRECRARLAYVRDLGDRSLVFVCRRDRAAPEVVVVTLWEQEGGPAPPRVPRRFTDALRDDVMLHCISTSDNNTRHGDRSPPLARCGPHRRGLPCSPTRTRRSPMRDSRRGPRRTASLLTRGEPRPRSPSTCAAPGSFCAWGAAWPGWSCAMLVELAWPRTARAARLRRRRGA